VTVNKQNEISKKSSLVGISSGPIAFEVGERVDILLEEVRAYCREKHGRRSQLARYLGLTPQKVTDILNARQQPTGEQALAMQEWLALERRKDQ
jgi:hypothetical protein